MKEKKTTNDKTPLLYEDNELLGSHILCKALIKNIPKEYEEGLLEYLKETDKEKYKKFKEWDNEW